MSYATRAAGLSGGSSSSNNSRSYNHPPPPSSTTTSSTLPSFSGNPSTSLKEVEILILGAGWTSTFLIPLLKERLISYAATTTTGRDDTIKFTFDPESNDETQYRTLPRAKTILVTFPLRGKGQSKKLVDMYARTHSKMMVNWIQLGSTGIWKEGTSHDSWIDRDSSYDKTNERAVAEDELMQLGGSVLNLAGLWGGTREPRNWVSRVAKSKEQLKAKGALHLIHGVDVARAVVACSRKFYPGERWLLTDRHIYDWWDLVDSWGDELEERERAAIAGAEAGSIPKYRNWVADCMVEEKVRALPRDSTRLGRTLDSNAFWKIMDLVPEKILNR